MHEQWENHIICQCIVKMKEENKQTIVNETINNDKCFKATTRRLTLY